MLKKIIRIGLFFFLLSLCPQYVKAEDKEFFLDIYRVQPENLDSYDLVKQGIQVNAVLQNNISTGQNQQAEPVSFDLFDAAGQKIKTSGNIARSTSPGRFSKHSSLIFSTNKIILNDGQEVNFTATSPVFKAVHPTHANTYSSDLLRTVSFLSLPASSLTFGTSLGISFLVGGLLSAYQNGISDFVWGGFNGSGFSFLENLFRKQPELFLPASIHIPFTLNHDLKISKGLQKEKMEKINMTRVEAIQKIQTLLEWGDLSGALEFSVKSGNKETYDEIIKKISL